MVARVSVRLRLGKNNCLLVAENSQRLRHQYREAGSDAQEVLEAIFASRHARDYALSRHDLSNISAEISKGTFRRHDNDAESVHMLVRLLRGNMYCHARIWFAFHLCATTKEMEKRTPAALARCFQIALCKLFL